MPYPKAAAALLCAAGPAPGTPDFLSCCRTGANCGAGARSPPFQAARRVGTGAGGARGRRARAGGSASAGGRVGSGRRDRRPGSCCFRSVSSGASRKFQTQRNGGLGPQRLISTLPAPRQRAAGLSSPPGAPQCIAAALAPGAFAQPLPPPHTSPTPFAPGPSPLGAAQVWRAIHASVARAAAKADTHTHTHTEASLSNTKADPEPVRVSDGCIY